MWGQQFLGVFLHDITACESHTPVWKPLSFSCIWTPTNSLVLQARCSCNHCLGLWLLWSRWGQGASPRITRWVWWKTTLRVWRGMKVATGEDVIWSLEHCNITDKESQKQGEICGRPFFNLFSFDLWLLVKHFNINIIETWENSMHPGTKHLLFDLCSGGWCRRNMSSKVFLTNYWHPSQTG